MRIPITFNIYYCVVILLVNNMAIATPLDTDTFVGSEKQLVKKTIGIGTLVVGYTTAIVLAHNMWWKAGFRAGNPFAHLHEGEPYLEDDMWHLAGAAIFTDFNYLIFDKLIEAPTSSIWASALTFTTFTIVECLDALEKTGKWGFSINDEIANCLGIGFWFLHKRYPNIPFYIKVGIRRWDTISLLCADALKAFQNFDDYKRHRIDHYSILKVEGLYKFYSNFHAGVSLSKTPNPENKNLWGVVVGYDLLAAVNKKTKGWWNTPLHYINKYGSLHIGYTYWLN